MRCKNCGWPNKPEATACSKCGMSLESLDCSSQNTDSNAALKKTISEQEVFGGLAGQPNICPKCSYPLRPGVTKCPNCQMEIVGDFPQHNIENDGHRKVAPRRPTVLNAPRFNGTVNVWTDGSLGVTPSFKLSPIKRNGERHDPANVELEGEEVFLNRENTDPGNMSITSRTQAVITRRDNQWYIEDKSEQKTTFVQVRTPQILHDGDIILLGNRLFVFHE